MLQWYYQMRQVNLMNGKENRKMEVLEQMNEQEMKRVAIEKYVNIQRIKKHGQEEVEYQEKIARAELQMLGISTEDLEISKQQ